MTALGGDAPRRVRARSARRRWQSATRPSGGAAAAGPKFRSLSLPRPELHQHGLRNSTVVTARPRPATPRRPPDRPRLHATVGDVPPGCEADGGPQRPARPLTGSRTGQMIAPPAPGLRHGPPPRWMPSSPACSRELLFDADLTVAVRAGGSCAGGVPVAARPGDRRDGLRRRRGPIARCSPGTARSGPSGRLLRRRRVRPRSLTVAFASAVRHAGPSRTAILSVRRHALRDLLAIAPLGADWTRRSSPGGADRHGRGCARRRLASGRVSMLVSSWRLRRRLFAGRDNAVRLPLRRRPLDALPPPAAAAATSFLGATVGGPAALLAFVRLSAPPSPCCARRSLPSCPRGCSSPGCCALWPASRSRPERRRPPHAATHVAVGSVLDSLPLPTAVRDRSVARPGRRRAARLWRRLLRSPPSADLAAQAGLLAPRARGTDPLSLILPRMTLKASASRPQSLGSASASGGDARRDRVAHLARRRFPAHVSRPRARRGRLSREPP